MSKPLPPAKVAAYVKAALAAGLKLGEFDVRATGDEVTILTHPAVPAVASPADDDSAWEAAGAKWRHSA